METIREPFDNSADASPVVFFSFFLRNAHTHNRGESAFCLRIPGRSSIRFYTSRKKPSYSQLLERFVLLPGVSWSTKYVVLRTPASSSGRFRYAPRARIRPDSENIRFASRWAKSGRDQGGKSERDSAIIKESEQMADVGAALK